MCHRLYSTEWRAEEEARRRAAEQEIKRVEEDRRELRAKERPQPQEERRVEAEVE